MGDWGILSNLGTDPTDEQIDAVAEAMVDQLRAMLGARGQRSKGALALARWIVTDDRSLRGLVRDGLMSEETICRLLADLHVMSGPQAEWLGAVTKGAVTPGMFEEIVDRAAKVRPESGVDQPRVFEAAFVDNEPVLTAPIGSMPVGTAPWRAGPVIEGVVTITGPGFSFGIDRSAGWALYPVLYGALAKLQAWHGEAVPVVKPGKPGGDA